MALNFGTFFPVFFFFRPGSLPEEGTIKDVKLHLSSCVACFAEPFSGAIVVVPCIAQLCQVVPSLPTRHVRIFHLARVQVSVFASLVRGYTRLVADER